MSSLPPSPRRGLLAAALAIALWASLATLSLALRQVPPLLFVGSTLLLGSTLGWRQLRWRSLRPVGLLLGVYGLFCYHLCLVVALRWAPAVEANLLNYLWPLLIVLLSPVLVPGTALRPRHVGAALLGFAGAAALVLQGSHAPGEPRARVAGYGLAVLAAVIWSSYSLLTRRLAATAAVPVAASCALAGGLALGCHALLEPRYLPGPGELALWLLAGLGPMGGAFYLWDRAMREGDPRAIGTLAYAAPLLSTLLLAITGQGTLGASSLLGALCIVGGALLGSGQRAGPSRS